MVALLQRLGEYGPLAPTVTFDDLAPVVGCVTLTCCFPCSTFFGEQIRDAAPVVNFTTLAPVMKDTTPVSVVACETPTAVIESNCVVPHFMSDVGNDVAGLVTQDSAVSLTHVTPVEQIDDDPSHPNGTHDQDEERAKLERCEKQVAAFLERVPRDVSSRERRMLQKMVDEINALFLHDQLIVLSANDIFASLMRELHV